MIALIELTNAVFTGLFAAIFWPFKPFDPTWALSFVSILSGLLMVWIFGKVSNQEAITRVKNKVWGQLLGVRLYQHNVGVVLRLQGRVLWDTLNYLRYSLVPVMVLVVPVMLVVIQLNLHFSTRPLKPGEQTVVKAQFMGASIPAEDIVLQDTPGVEVETPGVRVASKGEVAWRIRAATPGEHRLTLKIGEKTVEKTVCVGSDWRAVPTLRSNAVLDLLLYPGEASIDPSTDVRSVEVRYPPLRLSVLGWNIHWLVFFLFLSILAAFATKGVFSVEF